MLAQLEPIYDKCRALFRYDKARMDLADYHWDCDKALLDGVYAGVVDGMCATFALLCRLELDEIGIDNTLIFCLDEVGEHHLVCNVQGWILDNRQRAVMSNTVLEQQGYKFLAESGTHKGDQWHIITQ